MLIYNGWRYRGGGGLLQSIKIKFDTIHRTTISGWNYWILGDTYSLVNSVGSTSAISLATISASPTWDSENEGLVSDPDFTPSTVLEYMVFNQSFITFRLSGLTSTRTYKLLFGAMQSYNDAGDKTKVTINGVDYPLGGPNLANVVYKVQITVVNPASGIIDFTISPDTGASYACMNAMILEEYA